jgi:hypothetical protein
MSVDISFGFSSLLTYKAGITINSLPSKSTKVFLVTSPNC